MIKYWHFIFYTIYKIERKFHLLFAKVNPLFLIYKISKFEKYYVKKYGKKPIEVYNDFFLDKEYGYSLYFTKGFMYVLFFCFFGLLCNLLIINFKINDVFDTNYLIFLMIISALLNIFWLLKTEQYLKSFSIFDKFKSAKKRKYYLLNILFSIISLLGFIYSMNFVGVFFK